METNLQISLSAIDKGLTASLREAQNITKSFYGEMQAAKRAANIGAINLTGTEKISMATTNVQNLKNSLSSLEQKRNIAINAGASEVEISKLNSQVLNLKSNIQLAANEAYKIKLNENIFQQASVGLGNFSKGLDNLANKTKTISLATGGALAGLFKVGLDEMKVQSQAQAALRSTEAARFGEEGKNISNSLKMIKEMANTSVINEGDLSKAVAFGSSFVTSNGSLKNLSQAVVTLTQGITQSLNPGAEKLQATMSAAGKAISTGDIGVLKKQGVTLSENQIQAFKLANETQRSAMLAQIAADNYGNVTGELKKTPDGKIASLDIAFKGFAQTMTEQVFPALLPIVEGATNFIKSLNPSQIQAIAIALGGFTILSPILTTFSSLTSIISGISGGFATLTTATEAAGIAATETAISETAAFAPFLPIIGAIGVAIGVAVLDWNTNFAGFRDFLTQQVFPALTNAWNFVVNGLSATWNNVIYPFVVKPLGDAFNWIATNVMPWVGAAFQDVGGIIRWVWTNIISPVFSWFGIAAKALAPIFKPISDAFEFMGDIIERIWNATLKPIFDAIGGGIKATGDWFNSTFGSQKPNKGKSVGGYAQNTGFYPTSENGLEMTSSGRMLGQYSFLQKGEKVLTANQTRNELNKNSNNQTTNHITINITGQNLSAQDIADMVDQKLKRK